jgi:putative glutamine amidotransferase
MAREIVARMRHWLSINARAARFVGLLQVDWRGGIVGTCGFLLGAMMSERPIIGITLEVAMPDETRRGLELPADYVTAVIRAGGLPILLPFTGDAGVRRAMIGMVDGLLVPGGNDLDPSLWGEACHPASKLCCPDRTAFDLAMIAMAEERRMPTLGICLGCQVMNVYRKGTLHQHLPDAPQREGPLEHRRTGDRMNGHEVTIRAGTVLAKAMKLEKVLANSRHHQAINQVGRGLVATATAPDGVIEAVEDPTLPFWVAVQWHPENLFDSPHERLFEALVDAAREHRASQAETLVVGGK